MKYKIKLRDRKELLIFCKVQGTEIINDFLLIHYRTINSLKTELIPLLIIEYWEMIDD